MSFRLCSGPRSFRFRTLYRAAAEKKVDTREKTVAEESFVNTPSWAGDGAGDIIRD